MSADPTDAMIQQAITDSRTPEGIASMLNRLAGTERDRGRRAILSACASRVSELRPASDRACFYCAEPAEQGRLLCAKHSTITPGEMPAPWLTGHVCTGELDRATGIVQHPGETCPVCDAKTGAGEA